jgi:hypothetical protein
MVHCIKMNLWQIEFFIHVVAESGSFSRASAMIGLTQPAISRQVSALERELRLRLLHRRPRRCADGCRKAVSRLCQRRKDSNSFSQRAPSYSLLGGAGGAAARDQAACGAGDRRYRHEPAAGGRRLRSVRFGYRRSPNCAAVARQHLFTHNADTAADDTPCRRRCRDSAAGLTPKATGPSPQALLSRSARQSVEPDRAVWDSRR